MEKAERFEIKGRYIKIYVKISKFSDYLRMTKEFNDKYSNGFENYLGTTISENGKYILF